MAHDEEVNKDYRGLKRIFNTTTINGRFNVSILYYIFLI